MGYCTYITKAGYELQAKLFAEGGEFRITRVEVGRGVCPPETDPSALTALVEGMARATSTTPRREGCEVSLSVEYRSDLNGDLNETFQINEFGVFALGVDGTEILLLYGDLSDYPESAVPQKYGGCVRRYPINITIGPDANASLDYPAGAWMTYEEAERAIAEGLEKGLSLEDGTTVGDTLKGLRDNLERVENSLKSEDGTPVTEAVEQLTERVEKMQKAVNADSFYRVFEPEEWTENELRIPASEHGMEPKQEPCDHTLRQRVGRTAYEYDETTAAPVAALLLNAVKEALAANAVPDPDPETPPEDGTEQQAEGEETGTEADSGDGTEPEPVPVVPPVRYPVAEDGHVILTWEQVQYLLLEGILAPADEAESMAAGLGFNWQDRDNGVEAAVTLDELLTAAYLPALGGPDTAFNAMVTAQVLQGLRFRRGVGGDGYAAEYDLDGVFVTTWGTMGTEVTWDLSTKDLVVRAGAPFAGDLLVMGRADTGG